MADEPSKREPPQSASIEDHGVIGDLATAALVATDGRIDFLCFPTFDSPPVFASLLDPQHGGDFLLAPYLHDARRRQMYLPDTAVLQTRFLASDGVCEIVDLMPVCSGPHGRALIRWVRTVQGTIAYEARCSPRFDYARRGHATRADADGVVFAPDGGEQPTLRLIASVPLGVDGDDACASFTLSAGETATFVLFDAGRDDAPIKAAEYGRHAYAATLRFWRDWSGHSTYRGRWREMVQRSAITLKLLQSEKHGSFVAAATFGLPETLGGERNWDYRYTWIRDAAFTMYGLLRLGYVHEAGAFTRWVEARLEGCDARAEHPDGLLRIMYTVAGDPVPAEQDLDSLAGYRGSAPVRIGNDARDQIQLDIYGEMMDAAYLAIKNGNPVSYDAWRGFTLVVDWVCENWNRPDAGIWEVRGEPQHFLHSRIMCWVAIDRAVRLAQKSSLPAPFVRWAEARAAIWQDVFENFWDPEQRVFVQALGSKALDASALLMPLVRFISPTDPRWLSTLDAIGARLTTDPLVRRYLNDDQTASDGLTGDEASFTTCSFWYAECLARAGRLDEARLVFEKMLGYANHLGLYAEELGVSGEHLGNFPQALTHLALISAATYLDRRLSAGSRQPWSG